MAKYSGYDATLGVTSGTTYATVGQVRDIAGPSLKMDPIEVTHRGSASWREFVAGLRDGGEVSFDLVYDPDLASHAAGAAPGLPYLLAQGTLLAFRLSFPDTTPATLTFLGMVTGFEPKAPLADALTADVTIKVSGVPVWA